MMPVRDGINLVFAKTRYKIDQALLLNDMDCVAPIRAVANWLFPKLPGGDVKMYSREETEGMVRSAGFQKIQYRKISPFSFQCIAEKAR